jgi:hypothetical protein
MSNGTPAPERRGLHPLAWVGIGCGALLVIAMVVVTVGGFFLARTVKHVAEDFEDNPGLATARLIVKASPELEEVDVDENAGTMTVRNTKTGELITVDFDDIKEGRLSWTADGEEVTVDISEADSGKVTIASGNGEGVQFSAGMVTDKIPGWVPVYPGAEPENRSSVKTADSVTGSFKLATGDPVADVIAFYRDELKKAGFEISVNTFSGDGSEGGMVNGTDTTDNRTVMAIIDREDDTTTAGITFSEGS